MQTPTQYNQTFYQNQSPGSRRSAEVVVPLVLDLVSPTSVLDVGCGVGTWLSVFAEQGISTITGLDGDYVDTAMLHIPNQSFIPHDVKTPLPLPAHQTFDLAVSLEVAEHLPANCAESFVQQLTQRAPVILFSAAIPHQGGVGHINEQWPEYWAALFEKFGYVPVDALRHRIWNQPDVSWWYAQNMLFFVDKTKLADYPKLQTAAANTHTSQLSLVHPARYLQSARPKKKGPLKRIGQFLGIK
ncbi:MAG: class I SAM-dependent methyltransferase [Vampirovibrio sp.]|nr:class I SAM-dependent methyltransferase [Vampirovibrio sp.]